MKSGGLYAALLAVLVGANAHATPAAGADSANASAAAAPLDGCLHHAGGGASAPVQRTANFDEICRRTDNSVHRSLHRDAAQLADLTRGATAVVHGQARTLAAQYRPVGGSAALLNAPVDVSASTFVTRLQHAFGSELGRSSDRVRQGERGVSLRNSDALVRANVRTTLSREWLGFVYADMGAADSALKWQGLAGIRAGHGLELLGGWRHVTYRFIPGRGFDSLDFDGPFLGATLAW